MAKRTSFCKKYRGNMLQTKNGLTIINEELGGYIPVKGKPGVYKHKAKQLVIEKNELTGKWYIRTGTPYFRYFDFHSKRKVCKFCGKYLKEGENKVCKICL